MCVTLNDIEYVRRNLSLLPNELQLDPLLETIESADRENFECREEVSSLLDTAVNEMESQIGTIVSYIGIKVCQLRYIERKMKVFITPIWIPNYLFSSIFFADATAVEKSHVPSSLVTRLAAHYRCHPAAHRIPGRSPDGFKFGLVAAKFRKSSLQRVGSVSPGVEPPN